MADVVKRADTEPELLRSPSALPSTSCVTLGKLLNCSEAPALICKH